MSFKRSSGVLVHPTSFPSPYGIGDLASSAKKFIDFLESSKQTLWQVLPLGPTSFCDSPYQSFSTFAGNILLISPDLLKEEDLLTDDDLKDIPEFNNLKVDYGKIITYKDSIYKKAFDNFKNATKTQKNNFAKFCKESSDWLEDYSLFVALKDYFIQERDGTFELPEFKEFKKINKKTLTEGQMYDFFYGAVWLTWPKEIRNREASAIDEWTNKLKEKIEYHKFLQYEFFRQWGLIKRYANEKNVQIIGDIPIFVALDSADVWGNPKLFQLDKKGYPTSVAGVPPDYFSETGQLWGNPLYNWEQHKKNGYEWWITRIQKTLGFVDILRIDHFRGFIANWSVPFGEKTAINGKWCDGPGKELFTAVEAALGKLPIIAEDLGVITEEVNDLRDSFDLPGMKILQFAFESTDRSDHMPHNFKTSNLAVYTGTHDNTTTVGWYNAATEVSKDYFRRYMNTSGDTPAWDLIRLGSASCADIFIVPIQDLLSVGAEARMNVPGVTSGNWQFRYTEDSINNILAEKFAYLTTLFNRG